MAWLEFTEADGLTFAEVIRKYSEKFPGLGCIDPEPLLRKIDPALRGIDEIANWGTEKRMREIEQKLGSVFRGVSQLRERAAATLDVSDKAASFPIHSYERIREELLFEIQELEKAVSVL